MTEQISLLNKCPTAEHVSGADLHAVAAHRGRGPHAAADVQPEPDACAQQICWKAVFKAVKRRERQCLRQ